MRLSKLSLFLVALIFFPNATPSLTQSGKLAENDQWKAILKQSLPIYGDRNWIVVSDSAFPAYSQAGIETVIADQDLPSVLAYVINAISTSRHVRPTIFQDQELQFVHESDYPGVTLLRQKMDRILSGDSKLSIPHQEVLSKINQAGSTFRVLFIKTNATIPYTSVYIRLDCGYMSAEVERQIAASVAKANK